MNRLSKFFVALACLAFPHLVFAQAAGLNLMSSGINISNNGNQRQLDAAGKWVGHGYLAPFSKTLTEICVIVQSISNTPVAGDLSIELYADTPGYPSTSLASGTADPSTIGLKCVTVSQATTTGTQYWIVSKNLNGTPGTNNFAIFNASQGLVAVTQSGFSNFTNRIGMPVLQTGNGGVDTWTGANIPGSGTYRLKFSDNSYYGFPVTNTIAAGAPIDVADRVYSTNEVGNKFTTPANASPKIRCVAMYGAVAAGTPTGFVRYGLYQGTSLISYTVPLTFVPANMSDSWIPGCFATAQTLSPSTTYRLVMAETTQANSSSNAYGPYRVDWDTNANSLPLKPYSGTLSKTVCTGSCNGGTWTDTAGSWYQMALGFEVGDEFATTGGGGGGLLRSEFSGGMQ